MKRAGSGTLAQAEMLRMRMALASWVGAAPSLAFMARNRRTEGNWTAYVARTFPRTTGETSTNKGETSELLAAVYEKMGMHPKVGVASETTSRGAGIEGT